MNVGIGSSAAVEIGTLVLPERLPRSRDLTPRASRDSARWRRTTSSARRAASWTKSPSPAAARAGSRTSSAGPARCAARSTIPPGTGFVGINSMVRHSVAGNPYSDTRIGAFMGKKIINDLRARTGRAALDYLTELSVGRVSTRSTPAQIPDEHRRVGVSRALQDARRSGHDRSAGRHLSRRRADAPSDRGKRARAEVHRRAVRRRAPATSARSSPPANACTARTQSYRDNCQLSVDEVDFLVEAVR